LTVPLVHGQEVDFVLKSFLGRLESGRVHLHWVMQGGYQCNGTRILRSDDGVLWHEVGMIGGICGSTEVDEAYDFTDYFPMENRRNYYRTELIGLGFSQVIWVDVHNDTHGYVLLRSAPGVLTIRIDGRIQEFFSVRLWSSEGRLLFEATDIYQELTLSLNAFPAGIAILRLYTHTGRLDATEKIFTR
jgi:hypothetical protein